MRRRRRVRCRGGICILGSSWSGDQHLDFFSFGILALLVMDFWRLLDRTDPSPGSFPHPGSFLTDLSTL